MNEIKKWIIKNRIYFFIWGSIIFIVVPFASYFLSEISILPVTGGNDWAGFWGGYFGAILGGICTVEGVRLSIKYEKEQLDVEKELSTLPLIVLSTIDKKSYHKYFGVKNIYDVDESKEKMKKEECCDKSLYFVVKKDDIVLKNKLSKEEQNLLENNGIVLKKTVEGVIIEEVKKIIFIPIVSENVGNGVALNFRLGLHLKENPYDGKDIKYTIPKYLKKEDKYYMNILFEDIDYFQEKKEFVVRIVYGNIFQQVYLQEYPIIIEKGELKLELTGLQKKI